MSKLRRTLGLDRIGIKRILDFSTLRMWLDRVVMTLEENYRLEREVVMGPTAAETPNWFVREATAADVTAGNARAVGNLIVEHKTNGTKHEFEAS